MRWLGIHFNTFWGLLFRTRGFVFKIEEKKEEEEEEKRKQEERSRKRACMSGLHIPL